MTCLYRCPCQPSAAGDSDGRLVTVCWLLSLGFLNAVEAAELKS
jgi:hypothetical protein